MRQAVSKFRKAFTLKWASYAAARHSLALSTVFSIRVSQGAVEAAFINSKREVEAPAETQISE